MARKKPDELYVGDNLEVILIGGEKKYYQITGVDNLLYRNAHSALAADGTESHAEVSEMDPPDGQIYWVKHIEVDGNVKVSLKQPAATNRWGTNQSPEGGMITQTSSPVTGARDLDMWILKNYPPNVQLVNGTNVSITAILWWIGRTFSIMPLAAKPAEYTKIKIGGLAE